jgi:hypothetical protein
MNPGRLLERRRRWALGARDAFAQGFHTFVFAAYPVLVVVGSNAGVLPLDGAVVTRCLAIVFAFTAALIALLRPLIPALDQRAACLSFVFIPFNLYALVAGRSTHAGAAAVYTAASVAIGVLIVRPWTGRRRSVTPLNLAAGALLAVNFSGLTAAVRAPQPWRPAADALVEAVATSGRAPRAGARRDIYYVIVDGFGRPDVLRELYALDLGPFVAALESRGFVLPIASRSNYGQTFLSLGSSLNLSYLDTIASTMQGSADRRALYFLIQHNALTRLAKRAHYQVTAIGSDYVATDRLESADSCLCEQYGLDEIEIAAINLTPLRALPLDRWTFDAHRRKVDGAFRDLERAAAVPAPKLVLAHVLSPHPPFVFGSDGGRRPNGSSMFSFVDGSHYTGLQSEYIAGYRDQVQFVARRLLTLVDTILSRPGPAPVIILHGDHGPGSMWDWNDLKSGNVRERLAIFSAYYFPNLDRAGMPRDISPVNALRTMANRYLGTDLPLLPDVSFVSTWQRPYQLVRVDADDLRQARR